MAEQDIDLVYLERLIRGAPWREYLEQVLLPTYARVSQTLDVAQSDHRYLQGLKEGLKLAMEQPYTLTQQPSPLVAHDPARRRPARRIPRQDVTGPEEAPPVRLRPSYLA